MIIQPTDKWYARSIATPLGLVKRPAGAHSFEVDNQKGQWLIDNQYAIAANPTAAPERAHPPIDPHSNTEILNEAQPIVTTSDVEHLTKQLEQTEKPTELDPWKTKVLEFFNSQEPTAIAAAINGIGPTTAEKIVHAKPLDWTKVEEILSERQMDAIERWAQASSES